MLSLLIASEDPAVGAVVAYYPLADFEEWLDLQRYSFPKSLVFRVIRRHFRKELGARTWEEARATLRTASPIHRVERIQSPVLLIHGAKDRTAPLGQVEHLCQKLQAAGKSCELFVVPGAGHVFNFRDEDQARVAWKKTMEFLDRHLKRSLPYSPPSERLSSQPGG
jgi:acetyl esterase/lipase